MYDPLKAYERCLYQLHQPGADIDSIRQAMRMHWTLMSGVEREKMQQLSQDLYAETLLKDLKECACE